MLNEFRLVYPPNYDVNKEKKMDNYDFIKSLQIDELVVLVRESYLGIRNISLEEYFTTDTAVLQYRLDIVEDLVENPKVYNMFCEALIVIRNIQDLSRALGSDFTVESALSSIRYLEMYQEIIKLFADNMTSVTFKSEGMQLLQ